MTLSPQLLAILVCPKCKGPLEYRESEPSSQSTMSIAGAPVAFSASGRSSFGTTSFRSCRGARTSRVSRSVMAVGA